MQPIRAARLVVAQHRCLQQPWQHWRGASSVAAEGEQASTSEPQEDRASTSASSEQERRERQRLIGRVLRETHAAEAAAVHFFAGQEAVMRGRPDAAGMTAREAEALERVQRLMPRYHVRPSLLLGAAQAAGVGLGAVAALAPPSIRNAVLGGLQDAYVELYNDQLRALREAGLSEQAPEVRDVLRGLRDLERAPEGAPPAPDLLALQRMERLEDIGLTGLVGAVVKAASRAALGCTAKL